LLKPRSTTLAWATSVAIVAVAVLMLRVQGRVWFCKCGRIKVWSGDVWSEHNSQHLLDPYSFTHISHGLIFALLFLAVPWTRRRPLAWRLAAAVGIEALWEVVENSAWIIDRYRETTMALGYSGDSIVNSLGDVACFVLGFLLASRVKWYWSVGLFVAMELLLLATIRDNLMLNVLMLLWPVEAVKQWQMGGA